ncbi:unnamed protein product [Arctia plantaginis]|uniref:DDE-1 domain-containing protein n=1 Tax=Arctia plantaginis TaxID=874455 RepID=A0A8S1ATV1_ARCPL|nr:unnamed protein product [Arctia plantaginis]
MHHFAKYAKPTPTSPVLLLLDNHESHISVPVLDFCKESGIVLLTFPPHCSHKLQPLDLTVYGPLKNYYTAITDWLVCNPGITVSIYEIPKLATVSIPLAFKPQNIQKGFEKPGIWPFNSNIFTDEDFLCSSVTDRCLTDTDNVPAEQPTANEVPVDQPTPNQVPAELPTANQGPAEQPTPNQDPAKQTTPDRVRAAPLINQNQVDLTNEMAVPGPSRSKTPIQSVTNEAIVITPDSVRPYPKAAPRKQVGMKRFIM